GPSLAYTGVYAVWVNQTQPLLLGSTGVANGQFEVDLTDSLSYPRTFPVGIRASAYAPNLNVTIAISGSAGPTPGFPLNQLADSNGDPSYVWPSIPASTSLGRYTVTLTGSPTKTPPDIASLAVPATNVTISPPILTVSATTNYNNYTIGGIVVIYVSVVTPGGYNFTSGTVTATTYHSSSQIGSPLLLFFDQSRAKWVGSYTVNSTNPYGIWQIQVNASDSYGNMGQGSTSTLVSIPAPPQQSSTFDYLLVVVIALLGGLAVVGTWIIFGRRRV